MAIESPKETPRRRAMGMHKRANTPRLSSDQARRQGEITTIALKALGSVSAIAFLNTAHQGLGGRPLDVAIESGDGFERVVRAVAQAADEAQPVA